MSDLSISVPYGYYRANRTLPMIRNILLVHYHPEYVRRIIPWLASKGGHIGVGGHWRATGTQPDKYGFAPEGKSFHQDQRYRDGFVGACAIDLVARNGMNNHRSPYWSEVPAQGSKEAAKWGLHCNIGSEPWHIQPIEIDGWQSWYDAGRPFPRKDYPLPVATEPAPTPPPTSTERTVTVSTANLPVIREGSKGGGAKFLQNCLNDFEEKFGRPRALTEDGLFGQLSAALLRLTQARMGLEGASVDGICGAETWGRLLSHLAY